MKKPTVVPPPDPPMPKPAKCAIITVEPDPPMELVAQYNPKEVQIDKSASWAEAKSSTSDQPHLEFTSTGARTLSLELMFDTYEDAFESLDVHRRYVQKLIDLISVIDPDGPEHRQRPPRVMVVWGDKDGLPPFIGVIESVNTKYTMFLPNGRPVRATCAVKLKEASRASFKKKPKP